MPAFPPPPTLCTAIAKSGHRCDFVARRDSSLRINHDSAYRDQQRLNALKGAAASVATRRYRGIRVDAADLASRVRFSMHYPIPRGPFAKRTAGDRRRS